MLPFTSTGGKALYPEPLAANEAHATPPIMLHLPFCAHVSQYPRHEKGAQSLDERCGYVVVVVDTEFWSCLQAGRPT